MNIQLSQDYPAPRRIGRPCVYPYRNMAIGQSFFVPERNHLNTTDWQFSTGFKFTASRCTESGVRGMRVWRIA